jgi:hypothetical protein
MSDVIRDVHQEFWRPPLPAAASAENASTACKRCGTEFMVGAAFCHLCGTNRHRSDVPRESWSKHLALLRIVDFASVRSWIGLPLPALCAFLVGIGFLIVALSMGLVSVHDISDFEAVQLWRIQWLMAACAAFLVGILLKDRKSES